MVVIGALIVVTIALIFLARFIAGQTQLQWVREQPETQEQVAARIAPVGRVTLPGDLADLPPVVPVVAQVAPAEVEMTGPQVYNQACLVCHGPGIGGAPTIDAPGDWQLRLDQGIEVVYQHAILGYMGPAGYMPPKGGRADLSDEEVKAAVDYMLEKALD